jgi:hypothetical protein
VDGLGCKVHFVGLLAGLADLQPDRLELMLKVSELVVVQLELERQRLEVGRLDPAALLGALDESPSLNGLKKFVLAHSLLLFQDLLGVLSFQTRAGSEADLRPYDDIFL